MVDSTVLIATVPITTVPITTRGGSSDRSIVIGMVSYSGF